MTLFKTMLLTGSRQRLILAVGITTYVASLLSPVFYQSRHSDELQFPLALIVLSWIFDSLKYYGWLTNPLIWYSWLMVTRGKWMMAALFSSCRDCDCISTVERFILAYKQRSINCNDRNLEPRLLDETSKRHVDVYTSFGMILILSG